MGMFDSIYVDIKCPYCDKTSSMECQTKSLDCELDRYYVGDYVGKDIDELFCCAGCHSDECNAQQEAEWGYRSGFGMVFDVVVKFNKGIVTGDYKIDYGNGDEFFKTKWDVDTV